MLYARFSHPDVGRDYERKVASKVLKVGERYPVHDIQMGSWYTSVYLCGFDIAFNSVFFDFEGQNGEPCNIYIDSKYNPYVRGQEDVDSED